MEVTLTENFAHMAERHGCIQSNGEESWQKVLSLLKTAPNLSVNPLAPMQNFVPHWIKNLENKKSREDGYAIYRIFDDFSRNRYCPPKILLVPMLEEATSVAHVMHVRNMRSMLISLSYLAIDPGEEFLSKMDDNIRTHYGFLNKNEAILLLHGLAVMDSVLAHHRGEERYDLRSIYDFLVSRPDFLDKTHKDPDAAQINMMVDADMWFLGRSKREYVEDKPFKHSPMEGKIAQALRKCLARVFEQVDIQGINHPVDLSVIYNEKSFHMECDGRTHLISMCDDENSYMNGPTVFQSGLIQRVVDAPLVRLPSYVYGNNSGNRGFWREFLEQMTGVPEKTSLMLSGVGRPQLLPIKVNSPF